MSSESYQLGYRAEDYVCQRLQAMGWRIVERNFRGRCGEIDIVAQHGRVWVFAEVKASAVRPPTEALQARQIARIRRAAAEYLQRRGSLEVEARFDVFWVWGDPPTWEHTVDAF